MTLLMNRYLGKISRGGFLSNPPDDPNMAGGGSQGNQGAGDPQNQGGRADDQNDGGTVDDDEPDPEEVTIDSLFKPAKGKDAEDDFDIEDDDDSTDDGPTAEQQEASRQLGARIKAKIDAMAFSESDIPDDLDWSNKKSVASFMSQNQKAAVQNALSMVPEILNHGLNLIIPRLEDRIRKAVGSESKRGSLKNEFDSLGYQGGDREFAKTIFKRAMTTFKDPKKAAAATRKAMEGLGKPASGNGRRRPQSGDSGSAIKEGNDALDALFGAD